MPFSMILKIIATLKIQMLAEIFLNMDWKFV